MITILLLDLDADISAHDLITQLQAYPSRPLHVFYPKSAQLFAAAVAKALSATPVRLSHFDSGNEQAVNLDLFEACLTAMVVESVVVLLPGKVIQQVVGRLQSAGGKVEHQDLALTVLSQPTAVWTCA